MDDDKRYLYVCLIEEASEVIKDASKILRFGENNYQPEDPNKKTNLDRLKEEVADLRSILALLDLELTVGELESAVDAKWYKICKYRGEFK